VENWGEDKMKDAEVIKYVNLLEKLLTDEIDAGTFERLYLSMFKNNGIFLPDDAFQVLDGLFGDVDAFCAYPELRGDDNLNEDQLRDRCGQALKKLYAFGTDSEHS
jgi:hypothetical protein